MFSWLAKTLLVMSAIAPVGLVYAWVAYQDGNVRVALSLIAGCAALVGICIFLFKQAKRHLERFSFTPVSVEAADRENIAFMLLYLSPLWLRCKPLIRTQ